MVRPLGRWLGIFGPTSSGKSALALELAQGLGGEIINCDSVQLYRGFDIGAAKPTPGERLLVPHHLFDVLDWHEDCDASQYAKWARAAIDETSARGVLPIVTGGTGLYLRALLGQDFHPDLPSDAGLRAELEKKDSATLWQALKTCDPLRAGQLHPHDRVRVVRALELNILKGQTVAELYQGQNRETYGEWRARGIIIILQPARALVHERIAVRSQAMLTHGLIAEVTRLLASGVSPKAKPMLSIGYAQVCKYLQQGREDQETLLQEIIVATRQYGKRQDTWFKKVEADLRLNSWRGADLLLDIRDKLEP